VKELLFEELTEGLLLKGDRTVKDIRAFVFLALDYGVLHGNEGSQGVFWSCSLL
jgi:hypothetical protein